MTIVFPSRRSAANFSPHEITRGFTHLKFRDETYWQLDGDISRVHVLADAVEDGSAQPLIWTKDQLNGRVFVCILGQPIGVIGPNQSNQHANNIPENFLPGRDSFHQSQILCHKDVQASGAFQRRAAGIVEKAASIWSGELSVSFRDV